MNHFSFFLSHPHINVVKTPTNLPLLLLFLFLYPSFLSYKILQNHSSPFERIYFLVVRLLPRWHICESGFSKFHHFLRKAWSHPTSMLTFPTIERNTSHAANKYCFDKWSLISQVVQQSNIGLGDMHNSLNVKVSMWYFRIDIWTR